MQISSINASSYGYPSPALGTSLAGVPQTPEELLAIVRQQQTQVSAFLGSLGSGGSGAGDIFGTPGGQTTPDFSDPKGAAIDYLLGSTGGGGVGAGDIFNLALSANSQGLELAQIQQTHAIQAEATYREAMALAQMVDDAKQSNLTTLFGIGAGSAGASGISTLI